MASLFIRVVKQEKTSGVKGWMGLVLMMGILFQPTNVQTAPMFCPACPLVAATIFGGGLSTQNLALSLPTVGASLPFMFAFYDGWFPKTMTFVHPRYFTASSLPPFSSNSSSSSLPSGNNDQDFGKVPVNTTEGPDSYTSGSTIPILFQCHGLGSFWHLGVSELFLLNDKLERVFSKPVVSAPEFKTILSNLTLFGIYGDGIGRMNWTIPDSLPTGIYHLLYQSGWKVWRHEQKFTKLSHAFVIINPKSPALPVNATTSLLTMPPQIPPHKTSLQNATEQIGLGVIDVYLGTVNGLIHSLVHPWSAVKGFGRAMAHPIQTKDAIFGLWEESFDRNSYRATGQLLGAGLLSAQAVMSAADHMHEFHVLDTACESCAEPIRTALLASKKVKVSKVAYDLDRASRSSNFRVFAPKDAHSALVDMIADLGYNWT